MTFYKKIPVLDAGEQAEFDKYLTEQYHRDLELAEKIFAYSYGRRFEYYIETNWAMIRAIFDKLATPRIYLLQDWLHRKAQEKAGVIEAESADTANIEKGSEKC